MHGDWTQLTDLAMATARACFGAARDRMWASAPRHELELVRAIAEIGFDAAATLDELETWVSCPPASDEIAETRRVLTVQRERASKLLARLGERL